MLQTITNIGKSYRGDGVPFLLGNVLHQRGWKRTHGDEYTIYWKGGRPTKSELLSIKPNQLINHFPQTHNITKKGHLQFLLKSFYAKYGEVFDFVPSSFMYSVYTKDLLMRYFGKDTKKIWIGKPVALSRGRGILITRNLEDFFIKSLNQQKMDFFTTKDDSNLSTTFLDQPGDTVNQSILDKSNQSGDTVNQSILGQSNQPGDTVNQSILDKSNQPGDTVNQSILDQSDQSGDIFNQSILDQSRDTLNQSNHCDITTEEIPKKPYMVIVQEYISNPHLICGYKHDMRIYVLITNLHPLTIYLYNEGLSRFCSEEFSLVDLNPMRHLTNTSIHNKLWQEGKISHNSEVKFNQAITNALGPGDFSKRRLRAMFAYLYDCGIDYQQIWRQIKKIIILTLLPLTEEPKVDTKCFELLGFDILLTDQLKPMLIEVNLGPSLSSTCITDNIVKMPLLQDMLDIVLGEPQKKQRLMPLDPEYQEGSGDFELIFPFNQATESASRELAEGIHTQDNMNKIVEEVFVNFGNGVGKVVRGERNFNGIKRELEM